VTITGLTLAVPLVNETAWHGIADEFVRTNPAIGVRIQPSAGSGGSPSPYAPSTAATVWSTALADSHGPYASNQFLSIKYQDLNGDGMADLCYRDTSSGGGIRCALSTGMVFGSANRWTPEFGSNYSARESYWSTIQYADLNGDGRADVCGRYADGIRCALSTGTSFSSVSLWSAELSDASIVATSPAYYKTIRLVDVNHDGRADLCVRLPGGIYCALNLGGRFGTLTQWSSNFADAAAGTPILPTGAQSSTRTSAAMAGWMFADAECWACYALSIAERVLEPQSSGLASTAMPLVGERSPTTPPSTSQTWITTARQMFADVAPAASTAACPMEREHSPEPRI